MADAELNIITPALFSHHSRIQCGVSTRQGGVSPAPFDLNMSFNVGDRIENVAANRERYFHKMDIPVGLLAIPHQVHGDTIIHARSAGQYESCDALFTNLPNIYLVITVADCIPIFIYDPVGGAIAAVHAGWKGSKLNIIQKMVHTMVSEYRSSPGNYVVYLGPSAGACCYEVGGDVASQFDNKYLHTLHDRTIHLDLKEMNKDLLVDAGIEPCNIEVSKECTICKPDRFHSFRRDGVRSGRMMGVIGMAS